MAITFHSPRRHPTTLFRRRPIAAFAALAIGVMAATLNMGEAAEGPGIATLHPGDTGIAEDPRVLLSTDFTHPEWGNPWGYTAQQTAIPVVADAANGFVPFADHALRVTVEKDQHYGTSLAYLFKQRTGAEPEEIYFRYYLRFGSSWKPMNDGGKLPGIAGTYNRAGWGGRRADGHNGWSARGLFTGTPDGRTWIGFYCYHAAMGTWGSEWTWQQDDRGLLTTNRWYCIEQHVRLNTPAAGTRSEGAKDGVLRGWVDGRLAFVKEDVCFRHSADLKIDRIWIDIYYGGDATPPHDMHLYLDNLVIATSYIGPVANGTATPTAPAAPTDLTATVVSASRIDLSWSDASTNETGFIIERKTGSGGTWTALTTRAANSTAISNTGLTPDTTYVYRVRAANAVGNSAASNEATAQTHATSGGDAGGDAVSGDGGGGKSCGSGSTLSLLIVALGSLISGNLLRRWEQRLVQRRLVRQWSRATWPIRKTSIFSAIASGLSPRHVLSTRSVSRVGSIVATTAGGAHRTASSVSITAHGAPTKYISDPVCAGLYVDARSFPMFITLRFLIPHAAALLRCRSLASVAMGVMAAGLVAGESPGIAQAFDRDVGLAAHSDVLFFDDFESGTSVLVNSGRTIPTLASPAPGTRVLASHNQAGTNAPNDTYASIAARDTVYYRFYSRFEPGYDMGGGVKGPGVYAKKTAGAPGGGAGIKPQGDDKFSARLSFDSQARPYLYYYHMDMGDWGSIANQHIGTPVSMQPGTWYCIEMMLKANTPGQADGVLRLWIDGVLKVEKSDIRFRTTTELKINWIDHSAYFGGSWVSPKDQTRFEDNLVAAAAYIGPLGTGSTVMVPPAAPANLAATVVSTSRIDLSWSDASTNETGFIIERKTGSGGTWSTIANRAANSTTFSNTALTADTTYFYRIRATNSGGNSSASNEASARTAAVGQSEEDAPRSDNDSKSCGFGSALSLLMLAIGSAGLRRFHTRPQ